MVIQNFEQLARMCGGSKKRTVAVAAAHDAHALEAVFRAQEEGILDYMLVGDGAEIEKIAAAEGHRLDSGRVVDCRGEAEAAAESVRLVREGKADFLQKGLMQTSSILKAVLNKETGIGTGNIMSHVAFLDIPKYHKIVGVTDGGMLLYPDLEQKKAIVKNAVELFHRFGYEEPKVAALCAVEVVNPKMPESVEAHELKALAAEGALGRCLFEGPISFDLAVSADSAKIKGYESPVTGDADIFLVPDICTGNIMVKSLLAFADAKMAGCVVGAECPVALNSRSASFEEKYYSLLACAQMCGSSEREQIL
ncbi:phosphate acyltransferase [Bacilliculturomica massiliensis]|uniref:phosphate acyltransferase n=1 Tax=Bacilliculturomica massiliensis TaxID=1917867 RepID=UPI0010323468|nr:phosphate acyltransferase [Bacilliculturomica massiliensis]